MNKSKLAFPALAKNEAACVARSPRTGEAYAITFR